MIYIPLVVSTLVSLFSAVSADSGFLKFDAKKLKGSWPQNADIEREPIYGYYKSNLNISDAINGTVAGLFNDKIYYAIDLAVGSNAQNISVLVDTISSDLWINSIDNDVCAYGLENDDVESSNFTIVYEYTKSETSSSFPSSITSSSSTSTNAETKLTTVYSTSYNSESDIYVVEGRVSTDTTTTTVVTRTFSGVESYDIGFYPSASASTNWLSSYPYPTFAIENLEILDVEPQNCSAWGLFDSSDSDSFITDGEEFSAISLDNETITGIWAKDYVAYGNALLENCSFGLVDDSSSDSFGVLGLGLNHSESSYLQDGSTYESFPFKLKSSGFIEKAVYSIYDNYLTENSSLLFGGINLDQFIGNLSIVPLIEIPVLKNDSRTLNAIAITLSSIYFDDEYDGNNKTTLIASGLGAAIIDTGSSTASLPYYIHNEIVFNAGFNYSESLKAYVANATELENKTVSFDFQGVEINVPIIDLTYPLIDISGEEDEISDFVVFGVDASADDTFILGDVILQYLYIAIDLEDLEVAIAPKNFFPIDDDIVAVTSTFPNATTAASYNYTYGYNDVTELKLATVNDPNSLTKTSFSLSYVPSATSYLTTAATRNSTIN